MTEELDAVFATGEGRRKSRARCAMCGKEAPVRVQVIVSRVGHGGKPKQGQNTARSVRLCERHALAALDKIGKVLPI